MEHRLADWIWALLAALALLACAALILLVIHPGGFEGQVGWFLALMPGAILGLPFADRVYKVAPSAEPFALWGAIISLSLLWYFSIAYATIKAYRFVSRAS